MKEFAMVSPSKRRSAEPGGMFQGGMMPATSQDVTAMIVIDLRSLRLKSAQGKKLEKDVREFLFKRLKALKVDLRDRSAIDLSTSVFGISIE